MVPKRGPEMAPKWGQIWGQIQGPEMGHFGRIQIGQNGQIRSGADPTWPKWSKMVQNPRNWA